MIIQFLAHKNMAIVIHLSYLPDLAPFRRLQGDYFNVSDKQNM